MEKDELKKYLIEGIVKKIKEFGFTNVNLNNVLIDKVYKEYSIKILNNSLGHTQPIDEAVKELLTHIKYNIPL